MKLRKFKKRIKNRIKFYGELSFGTLVLKCYLLNISATNFLKRRGIECLDDYTENRKKAESLGWRIKGKI